MAAHAEPVTEPARRGALVRALSLPAVAGVLAAVVTRLPHLRDLTLFDIDVYLTLGQQWWHGAVPYRDLFDNKGQFLFELFAAMNLVLPRSLLAVHVFAMLVFALSVWQLAAFAGRHVGRTGAWCAAVAYGIAGSAIAFEGSEPNGDQLSVLGIVACIDCADRFRSTGRRRWAAVAGLALALAAGIKLSQLSIAPLVLALLLARPDRRVAGAAVCALAFLATTALTLVPYAIAGALGDLRFVLFDYSSNYVRSGFDALGERSWGGKLSWLLEFPATPLLLSSLVLGVVAWRDPGARRLAYIGAAWLLSAWVFARTTGRVYPHYFVAATPPMALLLAAGIDALGRRAPPAQTAIAAVVLAGACLPLTVDGWRTGLAIPAESRWMGYDVPALRSVDEAARFVGRTTEPDDRVFVATGGGGGTNGGQFLYWLADRRPAYRIFYPADVVPQRFDEVSAALARNPPDVLVWIPGTPKEPYEAAIANGRLEVVARFPGIPGQDLEVYARPGGS